MSQKKRKQDIISDMGEFGIGQVVWAKYIRTWWSGIIIQKYNDINKPYKLFWFADHRYTMMASNTLVCFQKHYSTIITNFCNKMPKLWKEGVVEALKEIYPAMKYTIDDLETLAVNELPIPVKKPNGVPEWVQDILNNSVMNNVEDEEPKGPCPKKIRDILQIRIYEKQPVRNICLGCYKTSEGFPEHPIFVGNMCEECLIRLKSNIYVKGDDGISYYCSICAYPGEMIICNIGVCGRGYCKQCLHSFGKDRLWDCLLAEDEWFCFICSEGLDFNTIIRPRKDYFHRVRELFVSNEPALVKMPKPFKPNTKLRVLSLFDGIATGYHVLKLLNLEVEAYYTSEIDLKAIIVAKTNFQSELIELGDITLLSDSIIQEISPIHLLMGGSPCNDLSLANPNRKGLFNEAGTGRLFFEYVRILSLLNKYNEDGFYWFFENVSAMPTSCKDTISSYLKCQPNLLDAVYVSAQCRPRLFWGNLPTLHSDLPLKPCNLQDCLMHGRKALVKKIRTITTKTNSLKQGSKKQCFPIINTNNELDTAWVTELELIFGFPAHYTDIANIGPTYRQVLLGRAWSVPVIQFLLGFLHNSFAT